MSLRPTIAEIDLAAIRHNVTVVKKATGVAVIAVVKADAYGHGAVPVAKAATKAGADALAVATVEEGIQLRIAGIQVPILVLGWVSPQAVEPALRYGLTLTAADVEALAGIGEVARSRGLPAVVHLKLDSGMGRLGLPVWKPESLSAYRTALMVPGVKIEGVYTHLSSADEADPAFTELQLARFEQAVRLLRGFGLHFRWVHAANSAAALRFPAARYDAVRVGIALYGLDPYPGGAAQWGLRPALTWRAAVAQVKMLEPGMGISYSRTFTTDRPMRVATVTVGYADGYARGLSNVGEVLVGGRRARVLGRVCMDQLIVGEVGEGVKPGDEVVLIGRQGNDEITATELARHLQTIPYEIVSRIGPRVPRRFLGD